jgi:predicted PurR-regulated permease PerM
MADDPDPATGEPAGAAVRRIGRAMLVAALALAGLWIIHSFLPALVWAVIFAIALSPPYRRLVAALGGRGRHLLLPLAVTLLIGLVFVAPVIYVVIAAAHETATVMRYLAEARDNGLPPPNWLPDVPGIGLAASDWWRVNLADPAGAARLLGRISPHLGDETARQIGAEILHRVTLFAVMLLVLVFLFRDGEELTRRLQVLSDRLLGSRGETIARHMVAAVRGTVNGLVFVGLGEGVLLGFAYLLAGLPHPVSAGVATGVLAIIPFGAFFAFGIAALYLAAAGKILGAALVFGFGLLVVFIADHFFRPLLIGGAARLPFLWVLLGILGGLESLGFLGLFVGPMVMAALISVWREWTASAAEAGGKPGA